MSVAPSLKRAPKPPQRPVARLDSIKNPQPRPAPQIQRPRARVCPNPECGQKDSGLTEDGKDICSACGTVINEMNMVSDLAYGLSAGGQHIVHGYHVGADQAFAKRGDVVDREHSMTSRMVTEAAGHKYIVQIGVSLGMNSTLRDMGMHIYKLAIGGFIQGRRIKSVAAVALYIACRTQKDSNTYMLIDFADILELDVFNLGHVYKKLLEHIRLNGNGWIVQPINPEDLILRFCERLEFGKEKMRVANDAVRIVQRMNRDWMTPGRRPAGICGAALILAARMNNFRRTVREVVYVVKVQEQTIFNRLDEFKVTESSGLTVDEFRSIDLERYADPPVFTAQSENKDGKKKKKRKRKHVEFDDDGDDDQPTVISSRASSAALSTVRGQDRSSVTQQHQAQIDSRNMPPPPLPIDPSLLEDSTQQHSGSASSSRATTEPRSTEPSSTLPSTLQGTPETPAKRKPGRPPKNAPKLPATPAASQRTDDPALEADITVALTNPLNLSHANALTSALESVSSPPSPPATQQETPTKQRPPIPDSEEILESEFIDDAEVMNCLLSPEEVAIKTRIWTHENRDYLRAQSAKMLKQQLAEENGTARTVKRRKRRRMRMGDMTAYGIEDGEERPVAGSPEEAVMAMMERRTYSKKLNYSYIQNLFKGSSSGGSSPRGSASITSRSPGGDVGVGSPDATVGATEDHAEEMFEEQSTVDGGDVNEQQKELESIAGELEGELQDEEGINDDDDEAEEEVNEDDDNEEQYDEDPYEGAELSD